MAPVRAHHEGEILSDEEASGLVEADGEDYAYWGEVLSSKFLLISLYPLMISGIIQLTFIAA